jgi:hypothetical protein
VDNVDEEGDVGPSEGRAFPRDDSVVAAEASELRAHARAFAATSSSVLRYDGGHVPRHMRVPRPDDPDLWAVRVKVCTRFTSHCICLTLSRLGMSQVSYFKYYDAVWRQIWRLPQSLHDLVFQVTFS